MFSIGFIVSVTGVIVAGLAGVLGVWMERDPQSRVWLALFFSSLIMMASGVEMIQTIYASYGADETDAQMALLLERLSELSENSPELQQFVATEVAVAARANPDVVHKMEANVRAKGGDPTRVRQMATSGRRQAAGLSPKKPQRPKRKAATRAGATDQREGERRDAPRRTMSPEQLGAAAKDNPKAAMRATGAAAQGAATDAATKAADGTRKAATDAANKAKDDATKAANDRAKKAGDQAKKAGNKAEDDAKKKAGDAAKKIPGL